MTYTIRTADIIPQPLQLLGSRSDHRILGLSLRRLVDLCVDA